MASTTTELIRVVYQGQAMPATQPIPPNVPGSRRHARTSRRRTIPAARAALLDKFGYVDRDGDGWRDLPDGKPLMLTMASTPTARDREIDEIWQKNMKAIGIRIEFIKQKWPDLLKMGKAGKLQMWRIGWINAYARRRRVRAAAVRQEHRADELFALRPAGVRRRCTVSRGCCPTAPSATSCIGGCRSSWPRTTRGRCACTRSRRRSLQPWVRGYKKHAYWEHPWLYIGVRQRATGRALTLR